MLIFETASVTCRACGTAAGVTLRPAPDGKQYVGGKEVRHCPFCGEAAVDPDTAVADAGRRGAAGLKTPEGNLREQGGKRGQGRP